MFRELGGELNVNGDNRLESIRNAHNNERSEGKEERIETTDAMEDYLEVMYELIQKKRVCHNYRHCKISSCKFTKCY
jgi:hypothetical protein